MGTDEREEITAAAIARLAGVGRSAVANWRRRYPDFPNPAGGSPTSPTFDRGAVEAWLKSTGKAEQLATAGRTETGTERIAAPERSVSDLGTGELLGRVMAALLPRETASDASVAIRIRKRMPRSRGEFSPIHFVSKSDGREKRIGGHPLEFRRAGNRLAIGICKKDSKASQE